MLENLYYETSPDQLVIIDSNFKIVSGNKTFLDFAGENFSELTGKPLSLFLSENETEPFKEFFFTGRVGEKKNFTWKRKDGTEKPAKFKLNNKSQEGCIFKIEDPGALNTKWGKKFVNEQILQLLLNLVPFPLFVKNNLSEYVLLNQAQADLFGLTFEEMIGKSDEAFIKNEKELQLVKSSDLNVLNFMVKSTLNNQQITTPNGKMYILDTIKVPFINDVTGDANILGVSIDITDRKLAEFELKRLNYERDKLFKKVSIELNETLKPILSSLKNINSEKLNDQEVIIGQLEKGISTMNSFLEEMDRFSVNT